MVAARIAFETKIADTAAKGATFAEKHAEMVGRTLEALRKSGDEHPFARVQHNHAAWRERLSEFRRPQRT